MIPTARRPHAPAAAIALAALLAAGAPHRAQAQSHPADPAPPQDTNGAISPKDEADSLHYVIAADREALCRALVDRPAPSSAESPACPSLMLRAAAEAIQINGAEFSFALRASVPVGARNGPQTDLEKTALAFLAAHPGQNYYGHETLGGRQYFTAVYPDLPAAASCVACHNTRAAPARPARVGDPLGAVVVRVPLEF